MAFAENPQGRKPPAGRSRRRIAGVIAAALVSLTASFAALPSGVAATPPPVPLTAQDAADLNRIAVYLDGITTMYAQFHQYSANGGTATGRMWMDRPGRMRFEYNPPSPILLLADRFYVYYIDKQLAEVQQVGLTSTPAWLLLREPVTFEDLIVTGFARGPNLLQLTVVEKAHPDNGSLTMVFRDNPLALLQWTIIDAERRSTTVVLSDEEFGMALDPKLFVYTNPFTGQRNNDIRN